VTPRGDGSTNRGRYRVDRLDVGDESASLLADLHVGLASTPKSIPPKWFYDEEGSRLFEQITRLREYYPTEAERAILTEGADAMVALAGADTLVELGAGVSDKTTALLDAIGRRNNGKIRFVPFDISEAAIETGASRLLERYPDIEIHGVVGDFDLHLGQLPTAGRRMIAFLGGTIGNYPPEPRLQLLRQIISSMDYDDHLLLGTDLVKGEDRLVVAYDDPTGVTALFNKNVITVMARTFDLDISADDFEHRAIWNRDEAWIEMHLIANRDISFDLPGMHVDITRGEYLLTEVSAKFTPESLLADFEAVGLRAVETWTDGDFLVSLSRLDK